MMLILQVPIDMMNSHIVGIWFGFRRANVSVSYGQRKTGGRFRFLPPDLCLKRRKGRAPCEAQLKAVGFETAQVKCWLVIFRRCTIYTRPELKINMRL